MPARAKPTLALVRGILQRQERSVRTSGRQLAGNAGNGRSRGRDWSLRMRN
jgi:hypothetical protein